MAPGRWTDLPIYERGAANAHLHAEVEALMEGAVVKDNHHDVGEAPAKGKQVGLQNSDLRSRLEVGHEEPQKHSLPNPEGLLKIYTTQGRH